MELTPERVFEHLAGVRAALTDLLDAVESATGGDSAIEEAQLRAEHHADLLGDPLDLLNSIPAGDRDRLLDELEDWMRLVSLATAAVSRNRESAEVALEQLQSGRRSLIALGRGGQEPGRTCDMSA